MRTLAILLVILGTPGVVALLFWRPAFGAALILALAPLEGALTFGGQSAVLLATVLCTGVFLLRAILTQGGVTIDSTTRFLGMFLLWASLSLLWNQDQTKVASQWVSFVLQCGLYVLVLNLVSSRDDLRVALWGHVLGGCVLAASVTHAMVTRDFARLAGAAGLGINVASRLVGLSLILCLILYQMDTTRLARSCLLAAAVLLGVGSVVGLSRSTWLGVILGVAVVAMGSALRNKSQIATKQVLVWSLVGGAVFLILANWVFDEHGIAKIAARFRAGYTLSDSASGRFDIWQRGFERLAEAPLLGHGLHSFERENAHDSKGAHNSFVMVSVETGLIGLVFFLLVFASMLRELRLLLHRAGAASPALAWGTGVLAFLLVSSMADSAVSRKYFWYGLSLITLIVRHCGGDEPLPAEGESEVVPGSEPAQA